MKIKLKEINLHYVPQKQKLQGWVFHAVRWPILLCLANLLTPSPIAGITQV